ncbi:uncharacterized membrane protein YkvA (DUF1232 family) [Sphaerisporangium krabiense]|uniref:Uncharacterized membrane protein YkvA (DUF1232 family) n=1 Tax=Sphaerisporangium krabiense TaxID=763782 RepID=A0A7W8ZAC4_9ACTN|nr:uncharacterized membrane protein YkvA (DUF1232 family) [Sphaerisporangium krabiense]
MTGSWGWDLVIGLGGALVVTWVVLVGALAVVRPRGGLMREALRLLPDTLRLVRRLAADPALPRGVRVRLALLLVYLACPIDVVPDFIPVLGYADDAIVVTAVLRSVVRRAGLEAVRRHWPGTDDGFTALTRLTGLVSAQRGVGEADEGARGDVPGAVEAGPPQQGQRGQGDGRGRPVDDGGPA